VTPSFSFQLDPSDVIEGLERVEYPSRPRSWLANVGFTALGVLLLIRGGTGFLAPGLDGREWKDMWLVALGLGAITLLMFRPLVRVLKARVRERRPLTVVFDQSGVRATQDGTATRSHPWAQLEKIHTGYRGVLLDFDDHATYWIPRRAFTSTREREAFIAFVQGILPAPKRAV
jgi:hypothetical protein